MKNFASMPQPVLRRMLVPACKAALTALALWLLLRRGVTLDGQTIQVSEAIGARLSTLPWVHMAPVLLAAVAVKLLGVGCAIVRWQQLLLGQGIRFAWQHVAGTFLMGRFFGIFLPGTLGLDGYKALDVTRATGHVAEPLAATLVEKLFGLSGMALVYVLAAPWGLAVLGKRAHLILGVTLPIAVGLVSATVYALVRPKGGVRWVQLLHRRLPNAAAAFLQKVVTAIGAYTGQSTRLLAVLLLSFMVHVTTAYVYVLTAIAVAAPNVHALEIIFASSIQILATVLSPLTIAGEGVREVVQALLLAKTIGLSNSILSAALGFWVAEVAPALMGVLIWWRRSAAYRPTVRIEKRSAASASIQHVRQHVRQHARDSSR